MMDREVEAYTGELAHLRKRVKVQSQAINVLTKRVIELTRRLRKVQSISREMARRMGVR